MGNTIEEKSIELQEEREKCFVIMPISDQGDYSKGHFQKVFEQIFKPAIWDAGYEAYRVDQDKINSPTPGLAERPLPVFLGTSFLPIFQPIFSIQTYIYWHRLPASYHL